MAEIKSVGIEEFITLRDRFPVFDVRTPAEYEKGHIPGAFNLPLFSDVERALVGTTYQKSGRDAAILEGLEYVGPKMRRMVETVQKTTKSKTVLLHCWRGGMRSSSVAWLLNVYGFEVYLLKGGYKAFRNYVLQTFEMPRNIIVLSGHTGSGKSDVLEQLKFMEEQVIDLEGLAHHKGSAFGGLGELPQPTQQGFENQLAFLWKNINPERPVWLEDESQKIGSRMIPQPLWQQMRKAPVIFLRVPFESRVERLTREYGIFQTSELTESIEKLRTRLGGVPVKRALEALAQDDLKLCCEILLRHYYDKTYLHGLNRRNPKTIYTLESDTADPQQNAERLFAFSKGILGEAVFA
jgi:tRNA 2-selenouridine synthase